MFWVFRMWKEVWERNYKFFKFEEGRKRLF